MKRILASILALSTVCTISSSVLAYTPQEDTGSTVFGEAVSPRYTYIRSCNPTLTSSGSIKAVLDLYDLNDYSMTLSLQQYIGSYWETIDTWTDDGVGSGSISESCSLEKGEKYRAQVYVVVYDENGWATETTTTESSSVTAR